MALHFTLCCKPPPTIWHWTAERPFSGMRAQILELIHPFAEDGAHALRILKSTGTNLLFLSQLHYRNQPAKIGRFLSSYIHLQRMELMHYGSLKAQDISKDSKSHPMQCKLDHIAWGEVGREGEEPAPSQRASSRTLVGANVLVENGLLPEALPAVWAGVRLLTRVYAQVLVEDGSLPEGSLAVATGIGLLIGMDAQMLRQVGLLPETLATLRTPIWPENSLKIQHYFKSQEVAKGFIAEQNSYFGYKDEIACSYLSQPSLLHPQFLDVLLVLPAVAAAAQYQEALDHCPAFHTDSQMTWILHYCLLHCYLLLHFHLAYDDGDGGGDDDSKVPEQFQVVSDNVGHQILLRQAFQEEVEA
ncbi:hypothetical protein J437_LFUL008290 [Ladona fulva]|uniref:Uncharacterized protein n=1 Tax=Ladona fulva TaxID=123851 RepID=A0A8K0K590_LADFU|nr:hypothetical protein J437_LFUL008290 [Ladona fulva]